MITYFFQSYYYIVQSFCTDEYFFIISCNFSAVCLLIHSGLSTSTWFPYENILASCSLLGRTVNLMICSFSSAVSCDGWKGLLTLSQTFSRPGIALGELGLAFAVRSVAVFLSFEFFSAQVAGLLGCVARHVPLNLTVWPRKYFQNLTKRIYGTHIYTHAKLMFLTEISF